MSPLRLPSRRTHSLGFLRLLQWPAVRQLVLRDHPKRVADIGCGPMGYSIRLATGDHPVEVISVDLHLPMPEARSALRAGVQPIRGDACQLPLRAATFDCVVLSSVVQMVPRPGELLTECYRILRPGGALVLTVPNHYQFVPHVIRSRVGRLAFPLLGLPTSEDQLVRDLNRRFGVLGPAGYYSPEEIDTMLRAAGFTVGEHEYVPGPIGSWAWELGILAYLRVGGVALASLLALYPVAWLGERFLPRAEGCEQVLRAVRGSDA